MKPQFTYHKWVIARLIPYVSILTFFMTDQFEFTMNSLRIINSLQKQIVSSLWTLSNQTGLIAMNLELLRLNESTTVRNNPIKTEFLTSLDRFSNLNSLINSYRIDGALSETQNKIIFNLSCAEFSTAGTTTNFDSVASTSRSECD